MLFSVSPGTSNEKQTEISFCSGLSFIVREFVTTMNTSSEKVNEKKGCLFVLVSYEHICRVCIVQTAFLVVREILRCL